ncbi:MAG TPA: N-acetylmuramoyl-L-alanine amidase [Thermoanaerobaculia bacterium]|nr:N-acetylmuramoyl-L-alanine amidase [Thermoanaerobaculia bacterium]
MALALSSPVPAGAAASGSGSHRSHHKAKKRSTEVAGAAAPAARPLRLPLEEGAEAALYADGRIAVEVKPRRGEALAVFAHRFCGDSRLVPQLLESNHGRGLEVGMRYQVPYEILSTDWQLKVARKLFPDDRGEATGWRHRVRGLGPLRRESLWQLSEWFTGKGENFRAIREYNHLRDEEVAQGAVLTIPSELLRPAFGPALPVPQKPFQLDFGKDPDGEYAIYRLRPGEALYSGVVVRFTGRIYAADVNALAAEIAKRSGIEDVTSIPVGFEVKIPLELVQPEFLPEGDPRRKEYEAGLRASSQFSNQVRAHGLEGINIILDAGHGGHDSGATMAGVWESLYVYDIVLRVRKLLAAHTAAAVHLTTRDGDDFRIVDADVLPQSRRHAVLTNPPYPIEDPAIGVNLRWYLANSVYRRAVESDDNPQKVVFLSIHADSLHPSLRGAMAYIPAARMGDASFGKRGPVYELRQEFKESPRVHFPLDQRLESEGLSRELAKQVVAAFSEQGLPVHPFNPVRDRIIRNRSEWVPAVLRYNSVPAKMLLEVCNLNNDQDRQLLQTRAYRQKVAEAIVAGLLAYYGEAAPATAVKVAKAAR